MSAWVNRHPFAFLGGLLILWFSIFLVGLFASSEGAVSSIPPPLPPSDYDARLVALDKEAIDQAYREQVQHVFGVWMKDPDSNQPNRALTGVRNAQRAYIASMDAIKRREEELRRR